MPGNQRIYFACLGIAYCGGGLIKGVKSIGISGSNAINNVFTPGSKTPAATYASLPDFEISFVSYLDSFDLSSEPGLNSKTGLDVAIGSDIKKCIVPNSSIRFSNLMLSQISYNLSVNEPFTVERTYKGFSKEICSVPSCGDFCGCDSDSATPIEADLYTRNYYLGGAPSAVGSNPIQTININIEINRQYIQEFATRKPYGSYVTFPITTTASFEVLAQSLDNFSVPPSLIVPCSNPNINKENIDINICGSNLLLSDMYLTGLTYSGGEAVSGGSNLGYTATYSGYVSPVDLVPFDRFDDQLSDCVC